MQNSEVQLPASRQFGHASPNLTRAAILEQLDRILRSSAFSKSRRYTSFLQYCVEGVLDGRADSLKERAIGIDVFGRPPGYDPGTDHVVRSAAGEVRKRLAQYYQEFSAPGEIRIEIQPGSYIPRFALNETPRPPTPGPAGNQRLWTRRNALIAAVPVAASVIAPIVWSRWRGPFTLDAFWKPVLDSPGQVTLCLGSVLRKPNAVSTEPNDRQVQQFSFASTMAVARISNVLQKQKKSYRVLRASETSLTDLKGAASVLIGIYNNPWSLRLMEPLRFRFGTEGDSGWILDRDSPQAAAWRVGRTRDLALVSRIWRSSAEQPSVILGGVNTFGTSAAVDFVTDPEQFQKLSAHAPKKWSDANLQVVLSTDLVDGVAGPPKVVAVHCW